MSFSTHKNRHSARSVSDIHPQKEGLREKTQATDGATILETLTLCFIKVGGLGAELPLAVSLVFGKFGRCSVLRLLHEHVRLGRGGLELALGAEVISQLFLPAQLLGQLFPFQLLAVREGEALEGKLLVVLLLDGLLHAPLLDTPLHVLPVLLLHGELLLDLDALLLDEVLDVGQVLDGLGRLHDAVLHLAELRGEAARLVLGDVGDQLEVLLEALEVVWEGE